MIATFDLHAGHLDVARRVFEIEARAISGLCDSLDADFSVAVQSILDTTGRTIVCGMGKSGIVGKKIAATLASTGTPSFFMHPGEAYHGDLGMVTPEDIFIAISNSGETDEILKLLPFLKDNGNVLVGITGNRNSTLARAAHCHLSISVPLEACPLQLAPTSSTTATLAMGDALAVTLMECRGFQPENFARFHPGGSLGRRLLSRVENEMADVELPLVDPASSIMEVITAITRSSLGLAIVPTANDFGIITDGDVRRALARYGQDVFSQKACDLMSINPKRTRVGTRVEDALQLMERAKISSLLIFDGDTLAGVFKK